MFRCSFICTVFLIKLECLNKYGWNLNLYFYSFSCLFLSIFCVVQIQAIKITSNIKIARWSLHNHWVLLLKFLIKFRLVPSDPNPVLYHAPQVKRTTLSLTDQSSFHFNIPFFIARELNCGPDVQLFYGYSTLFFVGFNAFGLGVHNMPTQREFLIYLNFISSGLSYSLFFNTSQDHRRANSFFLFRQLGILEHMLLIIDVI